MFSEKKLWIPAHASKYSNAALEIILGQCILLDPKNQSYFYILHLFSAFLKSAGHLLHQVANIAVSTTAGQILILSISSKNVDNHLSTLLKKWQNAAPANASAAAGKRRLSQQHRGGHKRREIWNP